MYLVSLVITLGVVKGKRQVRLSLKMSKNSGKIQYQYNSDHQIPSTLEIKHSVVYEQRMTTLPNFPERNYLLA